MSTPAPALSLPSSKMPTPSQNSAIQVKTNLGALADKSNTNNIQLVSFGVFNNNTQQDNSNSNNNNNNNSSGDKPTTSEE